MTFKFEVVKNVARKVIPLRTSTFSKAKRIVFKKLDRIHSDVNELKDSAASESKTIEKSLNETSAAVERISKQSDGILNKLDSYYSLGEASQSMGFAKMASAMMAINSRVVGVDKNQSAISSRLDDLAERQSQLYSGIDEIRESVASQQTLLANQLDALANTVGGVLERLIEIENRQRELDGKVQELHYAAVFNQTISGYKWMSNLSLSPRRWAVGYQFLYVLSRVLNITKPGKILELGLGQSTNVLTSYAATHLAQEHYVVEHDAQWVEFYKAEHSILEPTEIVMLDVEIEPFGDAGDRVRQYKDFEVFFGHSQFDLIVIDGPFGGDMRTISRVDVLKLVPSILTERFVILVDDVNRHGEMRMVELLCEKLDDVGVNYAKALYKSDKATAIICEKELSFLTTM